VHGELPPCSASSLCTSIAELAPQREIAVFARPLFFLLDLRARVVAEYCETHEVQLLERPDIVGSAVHEERTVSALARSDDSDAWPRAVGGYRGYSHLAERNTRRYTDSLAVDRLAWLLPGWQCRERRENAHFLIKL